MAVTADRNTRSRAGDRRNYGLTATGIVYALALVCFATDGFLANGAQTAGFRFAGVAADAADNTDGADGDVDVDVLTEGEFLFKSAGLTAVDVGLPVFLGDNETVYKLGHASLTQKIYVGRIVEVVSATSVWVRIDPLGNGGVDQFTVALAGTNATALDLSTVAAAFGGTDLYVVAVQAIQSYTTSGGGADKVLAITTDYTVASGDITIVGDKSAKTLVITLTGYLT